VGTDNAVNYLPAVVDNRFVFNKVTNATVVPANTVWAVLSSADMGETIYEFVPEHEAPKVEIVAGKVYRIKNYTVNTPDQYKEHYLANSNASIVFPTEVEADDKSAMWVCTSADEENHKYKFVSALGTASFGWQGAAEEAFEYTIAAGTIDGTVTLINNNMSLALTTEAWNNKGYAAFNKATVGYGTNGMVQAEYWSTDWYLEEVENPNVSFTASIRKDNMWATMYLPYAVTIPQGVEVYYAAGIKGNIINLTSFGQTIPARTAVLLRRAGEAPSTDATADFKFAIAEDVAAVETVDEGDNLFEGKIMQTAIDATDARVYLLVNYNAKEKFYWMAAEYDANCQLGGNGGYVKCDANKCYLKIEDNASPASSYSFRFEGTTGVEDVKTENGDAVTDDDLLLIEYEFATERFWYYRYMSPYGDVLQEGRSPYWHGEHNYVLHLYPLIQGRLGNFVEQFIDQQRAINRTATLIDFIRGTSSKGVLVVDDDAFESMSREEVIDEYVRYNGVLFVKLKPGQSIDGVVRQYNSGAAVAGDFELLNLQLRLINEISGVNSAMQGQAPRAGTPASLYAQQVQNSSLNLKSLFDGFRTFRRRRDSKVMKTVQQFYSESRYIDLAGSQYSEEAKWYDPQKVQNSELDITISEGYNTPAYQMLANDFLMELFRANAVDVKTMLENSSYPFATKILEAIKRNEEAAVKGQPLQGIPPELVAQLQGKGFAVPQLDGNGTEKPSAAGPVDVA
jgi:hypothetical protein